MRTVDWVVMAVGLLALAGYGALVSAGHVPLRDDQGRVRPMVVIGGLGAALVVAGVLINARD